MTQRCIAGGIWSKTISPKSRSSAPSPRDTTRQSKASAPTSTLPLRSSPQGKCQQTLSNQALKDMEGLGLNVAVCRGREADDPDAVQPEEPEEQPGDGWL